MRKLAFLAPLTAVLAVAGAAQAQPADIRVEIGGDLVRKVDELGRRDIDRQVDELAAAVRDALARNDALDGAQVRLVLTDLKPNRPTFAQMSERPGLDGMRSISIGGATIEGEIITADGQSRPVRFSRYSNNLSEVTGYHTWQDADRAFNIFARRLADGRL